MAMKVYTTTKGLIKYQKHNFTYEYEGEIRLVMDESEQFTPDLECGHEFSDYLAEDIAACLTEDTGKKHWAE